MQKVGYECRVMGVPKTIDNDLFGTDHCPGYAPAPPSISPPPCMEVYRDAHVYDTGMITIIEMHGPSRRLADRRRRAGRRVSGCGPDLVYLPEVDFDMDKFIADVSKRYVQRRRQLHRRRLRGHPLRRRHASFPRAKTEATDGFGHAQLGGLASMLASVIKEQHRRQGPRHRAVACCSAAPRTAPPRPTSTRPIMSGKAAVEDAIAGVTDKMVGFECDRANGKYTCKTKLFNPSDVVANFEKKVPARVDQRRGQQRHRGVRRVLQCPSFRARRSSNKVNGLPRFANLKKVFAK